MPQIPFKSLFLIVGFSTSMSLVHMYLFNTFLFDFSEIIPYWKIPIIYFLEALILSILFETIRKIKFLRNQTVLNLLLSLITLISILFPILATVQIENNEFFPIYAIPLHFIFTLVWISIYPTKFD